MALQSGGNALPSEQIMQETQAQFYGIETSLKYAQAWSMIHFFREGDGGKWRPVLRHYVARLAEGDTVKKAFQATFGKKDLRTLQKAWHNAFKLPGSPPALLKTDR